jgi:hypothetical protein
MTGKRIGHYRVLRTLGVGGMGEVYLAERADAEFEQLVAIKVVHGGTAAHAVNSRLKIERQSSLNSTIPISRISWTAAPCRMEPSTSSWSTSMAFPLTSIATRTGST